MSANSLRSGLRGPNNIVFSDGHHIRFRCPDWKLGGTIVGDRTIEADGSVFFEDMTNNLRACIIFSTYKKSGFWKKVETGNKDEYAGIIYKCPDIKTSKDSTKALFSKSAEDVKDFKHLKDVEKHICDIKGSWLKSLIIDGKTYWDIHNDIPDR